MFKTLEKIYSNNNLKMKYKILRKYFLQIMHNVSFEGVSTKVHYCHLSNLSIQEVKKTLHLSPVLLDVKASLNDTKTKNKTTTKIRSMYIYIYIFFNLKCVLLVLINFIYIMNRMQKSSTFLEKNYCSSS